MNKETIQTRVNQAGIECNVLSYEKREPQSQHDPGCHVVWYTFNMDKAEPDDPTMKTMSEDEIDQLFFADSINDDEDLIEHIIDEILIDKLE